MRNFVQSSHSIITMPKAIRIPVIAASRRPAQRAMRCTFFELISLFEFWLHRTSGRSVLRRAMTDGTREGTYK